MGADYYSFTTIPAAAIPVPKEALQQPFDLQGFKLMTVLREDDNKEPEKNGDEYHGAMICLADTELHSRVCIEVIGPYEIRFDQVECKRIKHLDAFMPADTRDRLVRAFETYTGRKPDVVPGFWTVSATCRHHVELHTTWSLGAKDSIIRGACDRFFFYVHRDVDGGNM